MEELNRIEEELTGLLQHDKRSWVQIYRLMEEVDRGNLWCGDYPSYTAWVNATASKNRVHVSILWSRKKAGKMYADYERRMEEKGKRAVPMEDVSISPDNFVLIDKIAGSDSTLADDLIDKSVDGVLTRKDLKEAWRTVKEDRKRSGERPTRINGSDKRFRIRPEEASDHPDQDDESADRQQSGPDPSSSATEAPAPAPIELTAAQIVMALAKSSSWIPGKIEEERDFIPRKYRCLTELAVKTGSSHHARRLDVCVLETLSATETGRVRVHGIEIKVSRHDLLSDHKMQKYVSFCDRFWIAVPDALVADAESVALPEWGILAVHSDLTVEVIRAAGEEEAEGVFRDQTIEKAAVLMM